MNTNFCELNETEMLQVEGGNPVAVYAAIVVVKYAVIPAAKIVAEAAIAGFIVKAVGDWLK